MKDLRPVRPCVASTDQSSVIVSENGPLRARHRRLKERQKHLVAERVQLLHDTFADPEPGLVRRPVLLACLAIEPICSASPKIPY
jgi:hypothetical protein